VFGWRTENFQDAFDKNYNPEFLKYSLTETTWDRPHNYHLEILSTCGLIGFAGYLGIIAVLMLFLTKIIKNEDSEREKLAFIILIGAAIAYLGQNSFGIESSNSLQIWFWLLAFVSFYYSFSPRPRYSGASPLAGRGQNENNFYNKGVLYKAIGWIALIFIIIMPFLVYKNYSFFEASVLMGDASDAADIKSLYLWRTKAPQVLQAKVPFLWEQAIFLTQDLSQFDGKGILDLGTGRSPTGYYFRRSDQKISDFLCNALLGRAIVWFYGGIYGREVFFQFRRNVKRGLGYQ
jgi:hypothetical protein